MSWFLFSVLFIILAAARVSWGLWYYRRLFHRASSVCVSRSVSAHLVWLISLANDIISVCLLCPKLVTDTITPSPIAWQLVFACGVSCSHISKHALFKLMVDNCIFSLALFAVTLHMCSPRRAWLIYCKQTFWFNTKQSVLWQSTKYIRF